jgi:anaerobic selenocysteine-containing dehydrogenase
MCAAERSTHYTVCPYNCWPVNCGIKVEVEEGRLVSVEGNQFHDLSRGMLCVKGQSCGEIVGGADRVLSPMRRNGPRGGGSWQEISWEEALDEIAQRMRGNIEAGRREANALYHSHGNIVQRVNWKILTPRFANLLGLTYWDGNFPCWYDVGVAQALTGYWGLHDPVEMGEHSAALVNWAQDPCASMANMVPYITQLKERGGFVVTVDPRVTQTAAGSDLHVRPRLGTDVWLANAVAHILIKGGAYDTEFVESCCHGFERYAEHIKSFAPDKAAQVCGVPAAVIERLASVYTERSPLCTNLTRGALGKHLNGVQMVRSVLCLIALSGNVGVRGGGAVWGEAADWNLALQAEGRRPAAPYPPNNFNSIDAALEEGRIDTLLIVGGNPLSQWPHLNRLRRQLRGVGLIAVYDLFLNHTAREAADIILPATSWLEELGLRTSNTRVYLMDKALAPPGRCREASWWMDRLCKWLGVNDYFPWPSKEECLDDCLRSPTCYGITVAGLRRRPEGAPVKIPAVPYADGRFQSPSGKFEFYSEKAVELGLPPLPVHAEPLESPVSSPERAARYPLQLISARRNTHFHSFHNSHASIPTLNTLEPEPALQMHPKDAAARGIGHGDRVLMFNDRGKGFVVAELTTEVPAGHVCLNDCWPELNVVTPAYAACPPEVTLALGVGGQPAYQNTLVEVRRADN